MDLIMGFLGIGFLIVMLVLAVIKIASLISGERGFNAMVPQLVEIVEKEQIKQEIIFHFRTQSRNEPEFNAAYSPVWMAFTEDFIIIIDQHKCLMNEGNTMLWKIEREGTTMKEVDKLFVEFTFPVSEDDDDNSSTTGTLFLLVATKEREQFMSAFNHKKKLVML